MLVEVKSVTHADTGVGKFPDRPTERGRRHLQHLRDHVEAGGNALLAFVVPRADAAAVRPYRAVDPAFADLLGEAEAAGVALHGVRLAFTGEAVYLDDPDIPVRVDNRASRAVTIRRFRSRHHVRRPPTRHISVAP